MMKLLVSPVDKEEAVRSVRGGADIIDVKNPTEGSLGANFPWVIKKVKGTLPKGTKLSATIGDLPNLPGTASLASLGACQCGVDYVKAGLFGVSEKRDALILSRMVVKAVKGYDRQIQVVLAGYGDYRNIGSISPLILPDVASRAKADYVMIDTKVKDGRSLLDYMTLDEIRRFVIRAHQMKLKVGLAGSLKMEDIRKIADMKPDVIGVRGAVCAKYERKGKINEDKVRRLRKFMDDLEKIR
jgi:(5-formylfuran-3-yl)methyl phosphate synthase